MTMSRVVASVLLTTCVLAGTTRAADPLPLALASKIPPPARHPSRVLVRFANDGVATGLRDLSPQVPGAIIIRAFNSVPGLTVVDVPAGGVAAAIVALAARSDVVYAEPDYRVESFAIPNDALFDRLWGLQNTGQTVNADPGTPGADIRATPAWDLWTGDPEFRIAVIDTGINYKHPDLAGNIWTNPGEVPGNNIDDDENGYVDDVHGYNFFDDTSDPIDLNGHGSHIAGTIGAVGDDAVGPVGINWSCQLVALRFGSSGGGGFTSDAIEAIQYAIDTGIRVSNNSWGCYNCFTQALYDIIEASQAVDHIFVAASGNGIFGLGVDIDQIVAYPAGYDLPNIISVAAIDNDDEKAKFSNFGRVSVDIGAPGVNVLSTITKDQYAYFNGTSMATPHVTGVVALLTSRRPELTWDEIRSRVLLTARPVDALRDIIVTGGVVNAQGAIGDCNENGIFDEFDILTGTSLDCNLNGLPDECEPDCNENQVADECDIVFGESDDCEGNGVPDECQPDCNNNGVADTCDLRDFVSNDCNQNGIPDECETGFDQDCNTNGVPDLCDFFVDTSRDCNDNRIPDECDISTGQSTDCSGNGLPDECERDCNTNDVADSCDILNGTSQDVDADGVPDECALGFALVPIGANGVPVIEGQEIRIVEGGDTITLEVRVSGWDPDQDGVPRLRLYQATMDPSGFTSGERGSLSLARIPCVDSEDCLGDSVCTDEGICDPSGSIITDESHPNFVFAGIPTISLTDVSRVRLGSIVFSVDDSAFDVGIPKYVATLTLDVSPDAVGVFTVGFVSELTFFGDEQGPTEVFAPKSFLPARIVIEPDCNRNGTPDEYDLETGISQDCDLDGVPDECVTPDRDCNGNLNPDVCDTRDETSVDCNDNEIPDECIELEDDCNRNLVPDACDIEANTSNDCNENGIPDECLAREDDCNGNFIPDACDIVSGVSQDCDANGAPDECENDCNDNGLEDACDIADGRSEDRDVNDVPDECQSVLRVPDDFPTIQQAIDAANNGDVIQLGATTYRGVGNTDIDFRGRSVTLRGLGASETLIDCTGVQAGIRFVSVENKNARVEDLTIANAFNVGIAIFGSSPIIRRCTVRDCGRISSGILVEQGGAPLIEDCAIINNAAGFSGGGIRVIRSHPIIRRCFLSGNTAAESGGAIYGFLSDMTVIDCDIWDNRAGRSGGGIALVNGAATVSRTSFLGNLAGGVLGSTGSGGGVHLLRANATFASCLINGNESGELGGGAYTKDGDPTLTNMTIVGNLSRGAGGGFFQDGRGNSNGACCYIGECGDGLTRQGCDDVAGLWYPGSACFDIDCGTRSCCLPDGTCENQTTIDCLLASGSPQQDGSQCSTFDCTPTLRNSIIWDNRAVSADAIVGTNAPFLTIVDSVVQGFWPGAGNTAAAPGFVDDGVWMADGVWAGGDFRLLPESDAINTGQTRWLGTPIGEELDGHARVLCDFVDRGAYEFGIGDYDCSGLVDLDDFASWPACFTGLSTASYADGCQAFDFDADADTDLRDFGRFANALEAANPQSP